MAVDITARPGGSGPRAAGGLVGRAISRLEGPEKVTGRALYAAEVRLPGMLFAALVFSTIARGRIVDLDTSAAERSEGVELVMTHRNAPRMAPPEEMGASETGIAGDGGPVMQDDRVRWSGQPIAVVVASTQEQADHAATLVRVSYAEETAVTSPAEARRGTRPGSQFLGVPLNLEVGDAEAALADSPVKVDAMWSSPPVSHNAIEPHAATAAWEGGRLRLHDCTQASSQLALALSAVFGVPLEDIHVTCRYIGGGFGGKILHQHQILVAAAARLVGRPVRLALSREGVYRLIGGRAATEQRVALGADTDGTIRAVIHEGLVFASRNSRNEEPVSGQAQRQYATPTLKLGHRVAALDIVANGWIRAPGEGIGSFPLECAVDELAERAGIDPVALRLHNETATSPIDGRAFSSRHMVEALREGAERFGWSDRRAPGARREGEWLVGLGCAGASYPCVRFPGGAARITLRTPTHALVEVSSQDMGMGLPTTQTQVAADRLGLALEQVTFRHGDSTLPGVGMAFASQQTVQVADAIGRAADALVPALLELLRDTSSPLADADAAQVEAHDGGLRRRDDPGCAEPYADILARAGRTELVVEAGGTEQLEWLERPMFSFGAQFCEVRVNALTGETRVSRFLGSFDAGHIINPKTALGQFRGGIVMGIGTALMEETHFDARTGRIVNPSLADYHVPSGLDVPDIDVIWTDVPDPYTPLGARGIGELSVMGVTAAVANAVHNATGRRVRDLPITPDKLL